MSLNVQHSFPWIVHFCILISLEFPKDKRDFSIAFIKGGKKIDFEGLKSLYIGWISPTNLKMIRLDLQLNVDVLSIIPLFNFIFQLAVLIFIFLFYY